MAIDRGAGTEIIRTAMFNGITNSAQTIIQGEAHHIYTVLSIIVTPISLATAGNYIHAYVQGYDSKAGTAAQTQHLFWHDMQAGSDNTFVWNDKFSFTGWEPADFASGGLTVAADQDKLADQAGGNAQYLAIDTEGADNVDVFVTFIDQNNA